MMQKLVKYALEQLDRKGRKLTINDLSGDNPYLTRYYLAYPDSVKRERTDIAFNCFLHQFHRSDEAVFHNHPWKWYFTYILKGGYWEHTPWGTYWRGAGHHRVIKGNNWIPYRKSHCPRLGNGINRLSVPMSSLIPSDLHWIEIPRPDQTWTLFIRGRNHGNGWGFVPNPETGKFYPWEEYLETMKKSGK